MYPHEQSKELSSVQILCRPFFVHPVILPWKSGWKDLPAAYMEVVYVLFLGKKWNWASGPENGLTPPPELLHGSSSEAMSVT